MASSISLYGMTQSPDAKESAPTSRMPRRDTAQFERVSNAVALGRRRLASCICGVASSPLLLEFCQIRYALIGSADRGPLHRRVRRASSYEQVAVLLPPHLLTFRVRDGPDSLESRTGVHDMLPVDYYRQVEEGQDRNEFVMILQPSQPMQKVRMRSVVESGGTVYETHRDGHSDHSIAKARRTATWIRVIHRRRTRRRMLHPAAKVKSPILN